MEGILLAEELERIWTLPGMTSSISYDLDLKMIPPQCDIARGAHIPLALTTSQKAILSQFFLAYKASHHHADDTVAIAWQGWVQTNLNDKKNNPLEGRLSVQLVYDWSSYRLTVTFAVPLLLSLVLGFWYMATTGDVTTAWTISLYVVTAAAGKWRLPYVAYCRGRG